MISSQNPDQVLTEPKDVREYLNRYIFPVICMYMAASNSRGLFPRPTNYMARTLIYTQFFREWRIIDKNPDHSEISWETKYTINEYSIPVLFLNLYGVNLSRYLESEERRDMFAYFYLNICFYNHIIFMLSELNT